MNPLRRSWDSVRVKCSNVRWNANFVAKVCNGRRKLKVEVAKVCNCRRGKQRWRRSKCARVVENKGGSCIAENRGGRRQRATVVKHEGGGFQSVQLSSNQKRRWRLPKCVIVVENEG